MEKNTIGVRKGIWTPEEDILLRKCIENYGEGKWHLVPLRAGLNRCRKSCRLRWLNYLKPDIRRGQFSKDEVDLIIRLHKLLGNRWSLIAGRLPGRTANDVKNFWNSHIDKKLPLPGETFTGRGKVQKTTTHSNIVRPRPRAFSNLQLCPPPETSHTNIVVENSNQLHPSSSHDADECRRWWSNLLQMSMQNAYESHQTGPCPQDMSGTLHDAHNPNPQRQVEDLVDGFGDFSTGVDIWELLSFEDQR